MHIQKNVPRTGTDALALGSKGRQTSYVPITTRGIKTKVRVRK